MSQEQLAREIDILRSYKRELRRVERSLDARNKALSSEMQVPNSSAGDLKNKLIHGLPLHLVPTNVGGLYEAAWEFYYRVNFNFQGLAELNRNIRQTQFFQVTQESAFIMTGVSHNFARGNTAAGGYAPWEIDFRDRQSTRQLMNDPIPVQCLGSKGNESKLPTPYLLMPNAQFEVTLTCAQTTPLVVDPEDVRLQLVFHGLRMRIDAADKILSTIYGKQE